MARYHILIVDDQRDVRLLLRTSLETLKLDLDIIDVPSAEEALLILGKEQIDLMVVDVRLPGMSGLELRDRAGKRIPTTKLILITGLSDEKVQRQIAEADAAAYFFKPIQISQFLEAVRNCLGVRTPDNSNNQKLQFSDLPLPIQPSLVNQFDQLCAQQDAIGGWVMSVQQKTLYEWQHAEYRGESLIPEALMKSLLEQDRQQVQTNTGLAFPCHHLFSGDNGDLWISTLQPDLVMAILLPRGTGAQKALAILSEFNQLHANMISVEAEQSKAYNKEGTAQLEETEEFDAELNALLSQASEHGLPSNDLTDFWDQLIQEDQIIQTGHGVMTYEEAVRMGLAKGGFLTQSG